MKELCIKINSTHFVLEKLLQRQKQIQRKEEIEKFIEERKKLFTIQMEAKLFDEAITMATQQNLKNDIAKEIESKVYTIISERLET